MEGLLADYEARKASLGLRPSGAQLTPRMFERNHPIDLAGSCREHQYGNIGCAVPQPAAHLNARQLGKHPVQHHHVLRLQFEDLRQLLARLNEGLAIIQEWSDRVSLAGRISASATRAGGVASPWAGAPAAAV